VSLAHLLLTPGIQTLLLCLYGFQLVASLVFLTHPKLRSERARGMRHAALSWWPVTLYGAVMVVGGAWVAVAACALLSWRALQEILRLLPRRSPLVDAAVWATLPVHYGAMVALRDPTLFYAVGIGWAYAVLPVVVYMVDGPKDYLRRVAELQWAVVLTVVGLSHVAWILGAAEHPGTAAVRAELLTFLLVLVMGNDAAQFVFGKALGRRPLAPRISPRKTWEGFLGGFVVVLGLAVACRGLLTPFSLPFALAIGAGASILGLLGDLALSAIKRDLGTKDSGKLLPGQGGAMDRADSLIFTVPLFAHVIGAFA
jgi:phosphatidate cytidylyltransferase